VLSGGGTARGRTQNDVEETGEGGQGVAGAAGAQAGLAIEQERMSKPIMEADDIIANLRAARDDAMNTVTALLAAGQSLRAERDALAERLRQTPDMRSVIGELRKIAVHLDGGLWGSAKRDLADLLRRLDLES